MKKSKYTIYISLIAVVAIAIIIVGSILKKEEQILLQGVVECHQYRIGSKVGGQIERVDVSQGDSVTVGQILYTISTPELETKLIQATAARQAAKALDREVIAGARKEQIEAAYSLWQQAVAGKELAQKSYERIVALHKDGVVTTQKLDEATANFEAMSNAERAAYAQYSLAVAGATKEQKEAVAAKVSMAQGAIDEVMSYISDGTVLAPISGEVSTVAYYAGEVVGAGFPVVTILDLTNSWIEFNIKETLMPRFTIGSTFKAYIPAIDRHTDLTVSYISPQADFAVWNATSADGGFDIRTFVVKMSPTESVDIRPGMSAIIKI